MNDEQILRSGLSTARARYDALKRCNLLIQEVASYYNGEVEKHLNQAADSLIAAIRIIDARIDKTLHELETEDR